MVKGKWLDPFDGWLCEAEVSALSPFAAGVRHDEDAVRAALSEPWGSGQVEGQVNRLKAIKRAMYGRAGQPLSHPPTHPPLASPPHENILRTHTHGGMGRWTTP
nr:hypothetical protein [Azospirillum aestuarii]